MLIVNQFSLYLASDALDGFLYAQSLTFVFYAPRRVCFIRMSQWVFCVHSVGLYYVVFGYRREREYKSSA